MAKLLYEYLGYKEIPEKYFLGKVISNTYRYEWYFGSEKVKKSDIKKRVEELEKITNEFGHKKYRNIQIIEK